MLSIDEREQNLFRATAAMAQFYEEVESFLRILKERMEEKEFGSVTWRMRSGTFSYTNLTRRLLATATIMYFQDADDQEVDEEDLPEEGEEEEKVGKRSIAIDPTLRIPFVTVWLFRPNTIPSLHNLASPQLLVGAIGKFSFRDKRTQQEAKPEKPELALSNLAQLSPKLNSAVGEHLSMSCWRPSAMRKYSLDAEVLELEKLRLLEVDSEEKIRAIAGKLASFCEG